MMDYLLFLAFLTTTLFFVITPGPSVAFASAQAIKHGKSALFKTVAGDALGTIVHIIIAVSSFTALMSLSELVLPFLQIFGGVFIVYMAVKSFAEARKPLSDAAQSAPAGKVSFWAGFFACVTNPKAIVFFVALFPAFISPDHNLALQSLVYGAIFVTLDAAFILIYAFLAMQAVRRTAARWINVDVLSGFGLLGVGAAMILKGYRAIPSN
ncbi:LysE family translocator [Planktotalea sp.]|uniref:LysE family translocator n=1 Tax=Planktotalea sp. TaxID=2029877 RepID=UPI003297256F